MPSYKLTYFPIRARAELARLILAAGGEKCEDVHVKFEDWPEVKKKTPGGQLPLLEVDGKRLSQSLTIARFLARRFGLAGSNDWEQALCDEIVDIVCNDALPKYFTQHLEGDATKKASLRQELKDKQFPDYVQRLEKMVGGEDFFVGSKLTWADLAVYELISDFLELNSDCLKSCPKIAANRKAVEAHPKLKGYLEKRPKSIV